MKEVDAQRALLTVVLTFKGIWASASNICRTTAVSMSECDLRHFTSLQSVPSQYYSILCNRLIMHHPRDDRYYGIPFSCDMGCSPWHGPDAMGEELAKCGTPRGQPSPIPLVHGLNGSESLSRVVTLLP